MPKKRTLETLESISDTARARIPKRSRTSKTKKTEIRGSLATSDGLSRTSKRKNRDIRASLATSDGLSPTARSAAPTAPENDVDEKESCGREERIKKDPFEYLGDDEVAIIMSWLPAVTTEKLRRVSKLWKAVSERHNGKTALRRHYSHIGEGTYNTGTSREEANLRFRRQLYHEESLKAGKASWAIRFDGARMWHINNGSIVWANYSGDIATRNLDPRRQTDAVTEFNLFAVIGHRCYLEDILLTDNGDLIIDAKLDERNDHQYLPNDRGVLIIDAKTDERNDRQLMRLTPNGDSVWSTSYAGDDHVRFASKFAIGKDLIYRIEGRPYDGIAFIARSLLDGSVFLNKRLSPELFPPATQQPQWSPVTYSTSQWTHSFSERNLKLCHQGANAVFYQPDCCKVVIINTLSGDIVDNFTQSYNSTTTVGGNGDIICSIDNTRRHDRHDTQILLCRVSTYDSEAKRIVHSISRLVEPRKSCWYILGYDPDRKFVFRFRCGQFSDHLKIAPVTEHPQYKLQDGRCVHAYVEQQETAVVTLPAEPTRRISPQPAHRRRLEMPSVWNSRGEYPYMMLQDYLVGYEANEEELVVLSFWPNW